MKCPTRRQQQRATAVHSEKGFTIIELMIAMAILGIGVLGVASMQISATNGNASARKVTTNVTYASNGIEILFQTALQQGQYGTNSMLTQGTVVPLTTEDFIDNDQNGQVDEANESGFISAQWTVQDDLAVRNTKLVRYTITNGSRGSKAVTLNLIIPEII